MSVDLASISVTGFLYRESIGGSDIVFTTTDPSVKPGSFCVWRNASRAFVGRIVTATCQAVKGAGVTFVAKSLANLAARRPVSRVPDFDDPNVTWTGSLTIGETFKSRIKGDGILGLLDLNDVVDLFSVAMQLPAARLCGHAIPIHMPPNNGQVNVVQMAAMTFENLFSSVIAPLFPKYRWRVANGNIIDVFDSDDQPVHKLSLSDVGGSSRVMIDLERCCSEVVFEGQKVAPISGSRALTTQLTEVPVPTFAKNDYHEASITFSSDEPAVDDDGNPTQVGPTAQSLGLNMEHDAYALEVTSIGTAPNPIVSICGGQDIRLQIKSAIESIVKRLYDWDATMVFIDDELGIVSGSPNAVNDRDDTDKLQQAVDGYIEELGTPELIGSIQLLDENKSIKVGHKVELVDHHLFAGIFGTVTQIAIDRNNKMTLTLASSGTNYIQRIKSEIDIDEYRKKQASRTKVEKVAQISP